jgi:hypothetical protein
VPRPHQRVRFLQGSGGLFPVRGDNLPRHFSGSISHSPQRRKHSQPQTNAERNKGTPLLLCFSPESVEKHRGFDVLTCLVQANILTMTFGRRLKSLPRGCPKTCIFVNRADARTSRSSPAFAGSHGLPTVEECGCPPKPWRRRTGASAGYAAPQVPRAPARGAPLEKWLRLRRDLPMGQPRRPRITRFSRNTSCTSSRCRTDRGRSFRSSSLPS